MGTSRITVNGRRYDSPDDMPPDVRRLYEEAMRTLRPASTDGRGTDATQVIHDETRDDGSSVVIRRTVTVDHRTCQNADAIPPEMRRWFESELQSRRKAGTAASVSSQHVMIESRPGVRASVHVGGSASESPLPIDDSEARRKARGFVWDLAFWAAVALALWAYLGC